MHSESYHASKWALEGLSQSLAQEVRGFGIHVTLVEPGGFATDWCGSSAA
jgi:NAD(P)-dependent dehydrogenase (short-subunit alcohol dehydrogenase family)